MTTKAPRELLNLPKRRGRPPIPPRHGPKPSPLPPAFRPIHPSHLVARQGNGFNIFVPPLRKLVFEYCERSEQSSHVRSYLLKHVEQLARSNPHVEVVVKTRTLQPPIVRGLYCKFVWIPAPIADNFSANSDRPRKGDSAAKSGTQSNYLQSQDTIRFFRNEDEATQEQARSERNTFYQRCMEWSSCGRHVQDLIYVMHEFLDSISDNKMSINIKTSYINQRLKN